MVASKHREKGEPTRLVISPRHALPGLLPLTRPLPLTTSQCSKSIKVLIRLLGRSPQHPMTSLKSHLWTLPTSEPNLQSEEKLHAQTRTLLFFPTPPYPHDQYFPFCQYEFVYDIYRASFLWLKEIFPRFPRSQSASILRSFIAKWFRDDATVICPYHLSCFAFLL